MFNSMKHTARQTSTRTLADLIRAMDGKRAVTITYRDCDSEESVRTIEIHDIRTTSEGRIIVRAMCRMRGERRDFRPERIVAYTVHRLRFEMSAPADAVPFTHMAKTPARLISLEMNRDYRDAKPKELALAA